MARYPSKKCSASNMTLFPDLRRKATLSSIMVRFSSSPILRASVTWKSQVFPKMQHHPTGQDDSAMRLESSSGPMPCLCVLPNAVREAFPRSILHALSKNSSSRGLEPGHPPSTKSMPNSSSFARMSSLSSQENDTPSVWAPSLRVVSYRRIEVISDL